MKIKLLAKGLTATLAFLVVTIVNNTVTWATGGAPAGFGEFGTGLMELLNDASTMAMVAGPVACAVGLAYCAIRKTFADEHDHKSWNKRMTTCVICSIIIFGAGAIMGLAAAYFS